MRTRSILFMTFLLGCFAVGWAADHVRGDGNLTSKEITVADYNEIKIDGAIDFYYEQSDAPAKVEITVDHNLHQYINIEVKDRVLKIGFKGVTVDHYTKFIVKTNSKWLAAAQFSGNCNFCVNSPLTGDETTIKANGNSLIELKGTVTLGKLKLDANGSANFVVDDVKTDKLELDLDGSGSVRVKKGIAKEGSFSTAGGSDIHTYGLQVGDLTCKMRGSGLAEVNAINTLNAQIIGSGSIKYKGPAVATTRVVGKGTIEHEE